MLLFLFLGGEGDDWAEVLAPQFPMAAAGIPTACSGKAKAAPSQKLDCTRLLPSRPAPCALSTTDRPWEAAAGAADKLICIITIVMITFG
jgi:hypothetical protein